MNNPCHNCKHRDSWKTDGTVCSPCVGFKLWEPREAKGMGETTIWLHGTDRLIRVSNRKQLVIAALFIVLVFAIILPAVVAIHP